MDKKEIFIQAINEKKIVKIKANTKSKGIIIRHCVPYDYGVNRNYKDNLERYQFYDLDSPEGKHNLPLLPDQLLDIELTSDCFEPSEYVTWAPPYKWFVSRDWGQFS